MKAVSVYAAVVVIFVLLTGIADGKITTSQSVVQQTVSIDQPVLPVSAVAQLQGNISDDFVYSEEQKANDSFKEIGVKLPDVPCSESLNCSRFDDPLLICVKGQCICMSPFCWVYHFESSGWTSKNVFSCGECGQLGSWCNATVECDPPGECWRDGYCHCPSGEHYDGICVVIDQSWAYKVTLIGFGVVFLLAFLMGFFHLYKTRPWDQPGPWCCGLCPKTGASRTRRGSCEKSPAFTVQSLYASQISNLDRESSPQRSVNSEEGPSTNSQSQQHSDMPTVRARVERGSVISVETVTTSLSGNSSTSLQDRVSSTADSPLEGAVSLPISLHPTLDTSEEAMAEIDSHSHSSSNVAGSDISNSGSTSSCTHKRCELCLPKGLPSQSGKDSSSDRHSPGYSSSVSDNQQSLAPLNHPAVRESDEDSDNPEFEITHL